MFKTRRALRASQARVTELEHALADLIAAVEAVPRAIEVQPSTQARANLRAGWPIAVRVPFLGAGAPLNLAVRRAMYVLAGVAQ